MAGDSHLLEAERVRGRWKPSFLIPKCCESGRTRGSYWRPWDAAQTRRNNCEAPPSFTLIPSLGSPSDSAPPMTPDERSINSTSRDGPLAPLQPASLTKALNRLASGSLQLARILAVRLHNVSRVARSRRFQVV